MYSRRRWGQWRRPYTYKGWYNSRMQGNSLLSKARSIEHTGKSVEMSTKANGTAANLREDWKDHGTLQTSTYSPLKTLSSMRDGKSKLWSTLIRIRRARELLTGSLMLLEEQAKQTYANICGENTEEFTSAEEKPTTSSMQSQPKLKRTDTQQLSFLTSPERAKAMSVTNRLRNFAMDSSSPPSTNPKQQKSHHAISGASPTSTQMNQASVVIDGTSSDSESEIEPTQDEQLSDLPTTRKRKRLGMGRLDPKLMSMKRFVESEAAED